MIFPDGFVIPPLPYLVILVTTVCMLGYSLYRLNPPITRLTVIAFAPWMMFGGASHVLSVTRIAPTIIDPLIGTPAVYLTTFVLGGAVWIVLERAILEPKGAWYIPTIFGGIGLLLTGFVVLLVTLAAIRRGTVMLWWPIVSIVGATLASIVVWAFLRWQLPSIREKSGAVGLLVIFGHTLDAVTTAIGIDVLGAGERSPLPRLILDLAGTLPTADLIGVGWLFISIKIVLSMIILWLFVDYLEEEPVRGYLLLGVIAALGLGPGVHNLLLFMYGG